MKKILLFALIMTAAALGAQQQAPPQPAKPVAGAQASAPAAAPQPAAAAPAHHAPQAKSQEEFNAYKQVIRQQDPDVFAKAADDFAVKYPQSELQPALFQEATRKYFTANKADQVLNYARKTLALEPNNPLALAMLARTLAERTQETDIDRNERLSEAVADAQKVVATIDQSLPTIIPANVTPQMAEGIKRQLLFMAWDAEGKSQMELKQDSEAEKSFIKALEYAPDEARTRFRLALTLDRECRYKEALAAADVAIQKAQNEAEVLQQSQAEKSRLQQLVETNSTCAPSSPAAAPSSAPAKPPM